MNHQTSRPTRLIALFIVAMLIRSTGIDYLSAQEILVSPVDELEIFDPRVDSEGKPRALIEPVDGLYGGQQVIVPPFVLVHKQYYTGDRDFRAQNFPGGPCVVVVSHPYTGEQLKLDVTMLPGAPRVTYRRQYIDYDFGERRIRIRFCHPLRVFHKYNPTVHVIAGRGFRSAQNPSTEPGHLSRWVHDTGIPDGVDSVVHAAGSVANSTANIIRTTGEVVTRPVKGVIQSTPLSGLVTPEEDAALQRQIREQEGFAEDFSDTYKTIPVVR